MNYRNAQATLLTISFYVLGMGGLYLSISHNINAKKSIQRYQTVSIAETFLTEENKANNIDSVAVWHNNNDHWLIATTKSTHKLFVYDACTGKEIKNIGTFGKGQNQFARPNGIGIIDDLVFVVERDNHRVQAFKLPHFECLGCFAEEKLRHPYGIAIYKKNPTTYHLYITDNFNITDNDSSNKRVHLYNVVHDNNHITENLVETFGKCSGKDALQKVESILADPEHNRLFIADESKHCIKIFDINGFSSETFL
ncbi:MAG: hypothetical protein V1855_00455, partial [bacterium]